MEKQAESTMELTTFDRIVGVFTSPKETFISLKQKPTWLVPFIIMILTVMIINFFLFDIGIQDQVMKMQARNIDESQIQIMQERMSGAIKYVQLAAIPIVTLVFWSILSGILLFGTNTILGGTAKFKEMFSLIAWTSLIGALGAIVKAIIIFTKETTIGVSTSLAMFMQTPALTEKPSIVYLLLSKIDLFTIWGLVLWAIGISIITQFSMKKSATFIAVLWIIWIGFSVSFGMLTGGRFG